jgi:diaminobutyrate-2-oxoglutarate transaminase
MRQHAKDRAASPVTGSAEGLSEGHGLGSRTSKITSASNEANVRYYSRLFPTTFSKARGSLVYDRQGKEYVDFFMGAGALNYGHNHPALKASVIDYLQNDGLIHGLDMATEVRENFLEAFVSFTEQRIASDYRLMFPGPTGADAVEAALKFARIATGRSLVMSFRGGYHGCTLGALSVTDSSMKRRYAGIELPPTHRLSFFSGEGDAEEFLRSVRKQIVGFKKRGCLPAAVIVETVQAEGGVNVANRLWLQEFCRFMGEQGIVVIVDDIQVGCGRTGRFFSFEGCYDIKPDIICLSKSLSGLGFPLSLVLLKADHDVLPPAAHTGTFRSNNLALVAALRALQFWTDAEFGDRLTQTCEIFAAEVASLSRRHEDIITGTRGRGMIRGLQLRNGDLAGAVSERAFSLGLLCETCGKDRDTIKLLPPLNVPIAILKRGMLALESALDYAAAHSSALG